jgi:hypothetical protein
MASLYRSSGFVGGTLEVRCEGKKEARTIKQKKRPHEEEGTLIVAIMKDRG